MQSRVDPRSQECWALVLKQAVAAGSSVKANWRCSMEIRRLEPGLKTGARWGSFWWTEVGSMQPPTTWGDDCRLLQKQEDQTLHAPKELGQMPMARDLMVLSLLRPQAGVLQLCTVSGLKLRFRKLREQSSKTTGQRSVRKKKKEGWISHSKWGCKTKFQNKENSNAMNVT